MFALASRMAKAVEVVHGNGIPTRLSKTGPYRVHHRVFVTFAIDPFFCLAHTVTWRGSMGMVLLSNTYAVGSPGARVNW